MCFPPVRPLIAGIILALWASAGSIAFPASAIAESARTDAYSACMKKAFKRLDQETCETAGRADVERRLEAAYVRALAGLEPDQQDKLRASERQWTAFRASDCDVFYGKDTGTMAAVSSRDCMIDHAEQRLALDLPGYSANSIVSNIYFTDLNINGVHITQNNQKKNAAGFEFSNKIELLNEKFRPRNVRFR